MRWRHMQSHRQECCITLYAPEHFGINDVALLPMLCLGTDATTPANVLLMGHVYLLEATLMVMGFNSASSCNTLFSSKHFSLSDQLAYYSTRNLCWYSRVQKHVMSEAAWRSSTPVDPYEAATPVSLAAHTSSSAAVPSLSESPLAASHSLPCFVASAACAGKQTFGSCLGLLLCVCPSLNACPDFSRRCWECCWVTAVRGQFCHKLSLHSCQTALTAGAVSQQNLLMCWWR